VKPPSAPWLNGRTEGAAGGPVEDPVGISGRALKYDRAEMKPANSPSKPPPRLVLWWEGLETWVQLALSFPIFAVLTFLINAGPFNQPILRSVFYGFFEGGVLSGLMAVATATERGWRR
jgi:hypothetical protein